VPEVINLRFLLRLFREPPNHGLKDCSVSTGRNDSTTFLSEKKKELAYAPNAPVLVQGQFFPEGASLTHAYNHAAKI
jgi:hypothetical protein